MNNLLIDFVKMFFNSMSEEDFKAGLKEMGVEEKNINKLWEQVKNIKEV